MSEQMRAADNTPSTLPPNLNLRRLERIQTSLQYLAGFVLVIFIVLIVISYFQLRRVRQEIAEDQKTVQEQQQRIADNDKKIKAHEKLIKSQKELISGLQQVTLSATESNPTQGEQIKQTVEQSIAQTSETGQLPARIYVQIANEDQRKRAAQVARILQEGGYIVPGIENVRGKAPTTSQLRYCPSGTYVDDDLAGITKTLKRISTLKSSSISVTTYRLPNCTNVRPRHYEIWFGEDF